MTFKMFILKQPWWGKLLGCFFGYLIFGSVGALFGMLIGHAFDSGLMQHFSHTESVYQLEKSPIIKHIFVEATFSVMGYLAKIDGLVTESELEIARTTMQELQLDRASRNLAKRYFNAGKEASFKLEVILLKLKNTCMNRQSLLSLFLDYQYRLIKVDGLTAHKIQILNRLFAFLGFAPFQSQRRFYADLGFNNGGSTYSHNAESLHHVSRSTLSVCYAKLGISEGASKEEVKRAYRRLISRSHPDKLMASGASTQKIKEANERVQDLTQAYDKICAYKGW